MHLDTVTALNAVLRFHTLPQTKRVFVEPSRFGSCTLVWVLHDGTRRTLTTREQLAETLMLARAAAYIP